MPDKPNPADVERHIGIIHDESLSVSRAEETLRKRREKLDDAIAAAVTEDPASVTWYTKPGVLSVDEAGSAANLTELGIHRAMERQRTRAKERIKKERERERRASKRSQKRKGPQAGERPVGF